MIEIVSGNLFESGADAWINPVNCVGISGKGLALAFKQRFPLNDLAYRRWCANPGLKPGQVLAVPCAPTPRLIVNVPTKIHWRNPSTETIVAASARALAKTLVARDVTSAAVPALGCGNGGLDWITVAAMLGHIFQTYCPNVAIELYEPI